MCGSLGDRPQTPVVREERWSGHGSGVGMDPTDTGDPVGQPAGGRDRGYGIINLALRRFSRTSTGTTEVFGHETGSRLTGTEWDRPRWLRVHAVQPALQRPRRPRRVTSLPPEEPQVAPALAPPLHLQPVQPVPGGTQHPPPLVPTSQKDQPSALLRPFSGLRPSSTRVPRPDRRPCPPTALF